MTLRLQTLIEKVLFYSELQIILKYLTDSMIGLTWKAVILDARETIRRYFRVNRIEGTDQTAWWICLEARGLDQMVNPNSGIDIDTMVPPKNPLGGIV